MSTKPVQTHPLVSQSMTPITGPSSSCHFQHVPKEIIEQIFSQGVFSPQDFTAIQLTCKGFKDVVIIMANKDSLGLLLFKQVYPDVTPQAVNLPDGTKASTLAQFKTIYGSYIQTRKVNRNRESAYRNNVLLLRGYAGSDGMIGQMKYIDQSIKKNAEKMIAQLFVLDSKDDIKKAMTPFMEMFLSLYQNLEKEKADLAGELFNGTDTTISPESKLGKILTQKKIETDEPTLAKLSLQEKECRNRLFLLLGSNLDFEKRAESLDDKIAALESLISEPVVPEIDNLEAQLRELQAQKFELECYHQPSNGLIERAREYYNDTNYSIDQFISTCDLYASKEEIVQQLNSWAFKLSLETDYKLTALRERLAAIVGPGYNGTDESIGPKRYLYTLGEMIQTLGEGPKLSEQEYKENVESLTKSLLN